MRIKYVFILMLAFIIAAQSCICLAEPNIDNLNKYQFDGPDDKAKAGFAPKINLLAFFAYLLIFIMISVMAFLTTRWIATKHVHSNVKSKYMEIIDRLPLGNDQGIYIVKTPQGLFMLGVSQKDMCIFEKLDDDIAELIFEAEANEVFINKSFSDQLDRFIKKIKLQPGRNKSGDK